MNVGIKRIAGFPAGFSLLGLMVVLAIFSAFTVTVMRLSHDETEQSKWADSSETLQNIRRGILGIEGEIAADGTRVFTGFIADTGRIPHTVLESIPEYGGNLGHTLKELHQRPTGLPRYQPNRAASSGNVNETDDRYYDDEILISSGWKGPYVRLGIGESLLRDGWAEPIVSIATPLKNSIQDANGTGSANSTPFRISQLELYGSDRQPTPGATGYDADLQTSYSLTNDVYSTFTCDVLLSGLKIGDYYIVQLRIYGPNPGEYPPPAPLASSKPISVIAYHTIPIRATNTTQSLRFTPGSTLAAGYDKWDQAYPTPYQTFGLRKMRAYRWSGPTESAVKGKYGSAGHSKPDRMGDLQSAVRTVNFIPGENYLTIRLN